MGDDYVGNEVTLEDAKKIVINHIMQIGEDIKGFLDNEQK